jgi:hypothetical protein
MSSILFILIPAGGLYSAAVNAKAQQHKILSDEVSRGITCLQSIDGWHPEPPSNQTLKQERPYITLCMRRCLAHNAPPTDRLILAPTLLFLVFVFEIPFFLNQLTLALLDEPFANSV